MITWIVLGPALLMGILLLAAYLETHVVAPPERARLIRRVLDRGSPEEVEREVSQLLRYLDRPRPVRTAR